MTQAVEMDESLCQVTSARFSNRHFHLASNAARGQAAPRNVRFCMNKRDAIPLEKQA